MKYLISPIKILLIAIFLMAANLTTAAQAAQSAFSVPRELNLDRTVHRLFPGEYGRKAQQRMYTEGFFPIGWSRDGKFAYYVEPVDEECGCYYAELTIQDMRTDKVLWKFKYDQQDLMDEAGKMPPEDNIAKLWLKNKKLFSDKLQEHHIEQMVRIPLLGPTFSNARRSYTAALALARGNDDDGQPRIKTLTLSLAAPAMGRKVLYKADYKDEMFGSPLDAGVAGAIKSPFESRVAIVMMEVERGWEGPPNTCDIRIVGADLVTGFGKGK